MPHLRLAVLKTVQATLAGQSIVGFRSIKTQALLAYLAVEAERPHRRETLAGLLWPDQPERAAQHNLSQSLLNLRQLLGDQTAQSPFLSTTRHTVQFNLASDHWLDVRAITDRLTRSQSHPHTSFEQCAACMRELAQATELYSGPFLADFFIPGSDLFEEWALLTREWLQRQVVVALEQLVHATLLQRSFADAERYARRLVELEPLRESAHRQLMEILARSGQRTAALAQYDTCYRILQNELAVEPAAETSALRQQIQLGYATAERELAYQMARSVPSVNTEPQQHQPRSWDDWPTVDLFYGRIAEHNKLRSCLIVDQCQIIAIVGMGGLGKTSLAATFAETNRVQFERVIWQSLLNAPPLDGVLRGCLNLLSSYRIEQFPTSLHDQLTMLIDYLREQRCLLVLDNLESVLQAGERAGRFRAGYADYEQLIMTIGQRRHRSCLLLTSREQPQALARLVRETSRVRVLQLAGMEMHDGVAVLEHQGLQGSAAEHELLVQHYSGNPLALKLVADTILDLFDGHITAFLRDQTLIFDDIRDVLDQQFARLLPLEQDILTWLAIERVPIGMEAISTNLAQPVAQRALLEAIQSLQRRFLLEKHGEGFTLQNVVLEYVTDRFVTQIVNELLNESIDRFASHALLKAQAREDVRQSQLRVILQPTAQLLVAQVGIKGVEALAQRLLDQLRSAKTRRGYAAGNIMNLLLHIGSNLRGYDFSGLAVWQADLRGAQLHNVNLAHADLSGSRFTDSFHSINSIAYNPDGSLLALCSRSGTVQVLRVADMQIVSQFNPHALSIWSIAWSPDGCCLATGSEDHTIQVWNIHRQMAVLRLVGHERWVRSVAWSPDGRRIASGSDDHTVRLWDACSGDLLRVLRGHTNRVRAVAWSPDGSLLASASADHSLRVWDVCSGDLLHVLHGHTGRVRAVAWSPDGSLLASASADHSLRLWNSVTGELQQIIEGHSDWVTALAFHPLGTTLASGSDDQTIRLWDVQNGHMLRVLQGHTSPVVSLAFHPDGTRLASNGSTDHSVRIWDSEKGLVSQQFQGYTRGIRAIAFSPNGTTLAHTSYVKEVVIWDIKQRQVATTLGEQIGWAESLAFSPDGATIASGNNDWLVQLWQAQSGQLCRNLRGHMARVTTVAFSPDGKLLASGSQDTTIRLWDATTGAMLQILSGHNDWVKAVAFSPDGTTLASASDDQTVCVWDLATCTQRAVLSGHRGGVTSIAFSPDGTQLASGSADHTIRLWDAQQNVALAILQGHSNSVTSLAWSPDGSLLASASADQTVRLWDVHQQTVQMVLQGHCSSVRCVAFATDGGMLASSSDDETIRLWQPKTGQCIDMLVADGPYAGMNITGATGLTEAQRAALQTLGAVDLGIR